MDNITLYNKRGEPVTPPRGYHKAIEPADPVIVGDPVLNEILLGLLCCLVGIIGLGCLFIAARMIHDAFPHTFS